MSAGWRGSDAGQVRRNCRLRQQFRKIFVSWFAGPSNTHRDAAAGGAALFYAGQVRRNVRQLSPHRTTGMFFFLGRIPTLTRAPNSSCWPPVVSATAGGLAPVGFKHSCLYSHLETMASPARRQACMVSQRDLLEMWEADVAVWDCWFAKPEKAVRRPEPGAR